MFFQYIVTFSLNIPFFPFRSSHHHVRKLKYVKMVEFVWQNNVPVTASNAFVLITLLASFAVKKWTVGLLLPLYSWVLLSTIVQQMVAIHQEIYLKFLSPVTACLYEPSQPRNSSNEWDPHSLVNEYKIQIVFIWETVRWHLTLRCQLG